jgi:Transcription elongation factor, N-terminal
MIAAGYSMLQDELKDELRNRVAIERPRLIQRLQDAIDDESNLAENSEYQSVKADQEANEARITELEDKLARAEVIQRELGFVLMTEEYRVLESTSGTKRVEVRWKVATLEEAKQVASRHNARTILMEQDVPRSLRRRQPSTGSPGELDQANSDSIAPGSNLHH